jgi:hypothetical protein
MTLAAWVSSSATPEWFTPPEIVARVVKAMDGIDLDPCAEPARGIPAAQHFTKEDNGLLLPWHGRVFMNPPYGRGNVLPLWLAKLSVEVDSGRVDRAIALVPARTETAWFRILWGASALCFWYGRIQFGDSVINAPFPSVLGYFGPHRERFADVFGDAGKVIHP